MIYVVALHVLSNLVWIGSILAVAYVLAAGAGDAKTRGETARGLYLKLATPAFGASFVLGVIALGSDPAFYFKITHFMHAKLPLALIVIALHHVIGARAKKMASGALAEPGPVAALGWVTFVCAAGAALLAMVKPF